MGITEIVDIVSQQFRDGVESVAIDGHRPKVQTGFRYELLGTLQLHACIELSVTYAPDEQRNRVMAKVWDYQMASENGNGAIRIFSPNIAIDGFGNAGYATPFELGVFAAEKARREYGASIANV